MIEVLNDDEVSLTLFPDGSVLIRATVATYGQRSMSETHAPTVDEIGLSIQQWKTLCSFIKGGIQCLD